MYERKQKICCDCQKPSYIWSKGRCKECAFKFKASSTSQPKYEVGESAAQEVSEKAVKEKKAYSSIKKKLPKPSGEGALFQALWQTREHVCFSCNKPLGNEAHTYNFSHIITKKKRNDLRLLDKNIVLECQECHHTWDFGTIEQKMKMKSFVDKMEIIKELDIELYYIMSQKVMDYRNDTWIGKKDLARPQYPFKPEECISPTEMAAKLPMFAEPVDKIVLRKGDITIDEKTHQQALWHEALEHIAQTLIQESTHDEKWHDNIAAEMVKKYKISRL